MFHRKKPIVKKFTYVDGQHFIGVETDDFEFGWNDLEKFIATQWARLRGEKE